VIERPRKRVTVLELVGLIALVALSATLAFLMVSAPQVTGGRAARARAAAEIKALTFGIEAYYTDHGTVPRNGDTDELDPVTDLISYGSNPSAKRYARASKHLYRELTGDREPTESPDGLPEEENKPTSCSPEV
jgi:hypothetical protein